MKLTKRMRTATNTGTRHVLTEPADYPCEMTRYANPSVQRMLWGKAAGRCEFAGEQFLGIFRSLKNRTISVRSPLTTPSAAVALVATKAFRRRSSTIWITFFSYVTSATRKSTRTRTVVATPYPYFRRGRRNTSDASSWSPASIRE